MPASRAPSEIKADDSALRAPVIAAFAGKYFTTYDITEEAGVLHVVSEMIPEDYMLCLKNQKTSFRTAWGVVLKMSKYSDRNLILFFDCGDTMIDEATQVRDARGIVTEAAPIPGMDRVVKALHEEGFRMALVADGETESFENILRQTGLSDCFEERIISEEVGAQKPAQIMFETALRRMGLSEADKSRILMIGNNLKKDIAGANRFGIASLWLDWSPRYFHSIEEPDWEPDYTVYTADELLELVRGLREWLWINRLKREI